MFNNITMNLTEKASSYLKTLDRDPEWITNEKETRRYLNKIYPNYSQEVLNIQLNYGGFKLKVKNNEFNTKLNFISRHHILENKKIHIERIDNEVIFQFANEINYITNSGNICSKDEDNARKIHLTYERLETKIEQYALLNEFYYLTYFSSGLHDVFDFERLKTELSDFYHIAECSDRLNFCCRNEQAIILVSPWLEGEGKYINVYGVNNDAWKAIIKKLQRKEIIE